VKAARQAESVPPGTLFGEGTDSVFSRENIKSSVTSRGERLRGAVNACRRTSVSWYGLEGRKDAQACLPRALAPRCWRRGVEKGGERTMPLFIGNGRRRVEK